MYNSGKCFLFTYWHNDVFYFTVLFMDFLSCVQQTVSQRSWEVDYVFIAINLQELTSWLSWGLIIHFVIDLCKDCFMTTWMTQSSRQLKKSSIDSCIAVLYHMIQYFSVKCNINIQDYMQSSCVCKHKCKMQMCMPLNKCTTTLMNRLMGDDKQGEADKSYLSFKGVSFIKHKWQL